MPRCPACKDEIPHRKVKWSFKCPHCGRKLKLRNYVTLLIIAGVISGFPLLFSENIIFVSIFTLVILLIVLAYYFIYFVEENLQID